MPDFSIKIVPVGNGQSAFQPDLPGTKPGDPLSVPPGSLASWDNQTNQPHQVQFDDNTYTSNEILPGFTSAVDYVAPASGSFTYHCTNHPGETGAIVVQEPVPMPPIGVVLLILALSGLAAPLTHAQSVSANTSQIPCLAAQQPLARIPELLSKDGRLRATVITGTEQVRMPTRFADPTKTPPAKPPVQPGDPASMQVCYPEWVRTFRSPDTTTPFPPPVNGFNDLMPGPTLRARVGDFIELTLVNEIDPSKFGQSIDSDTCDTTSIGYPGQAHDHFPDCFHGSTTVNMHFHGTHTNPTTTGDNVFLEILSSKRLVGGTPPPPPPNFDAWFTQCETELSKGSHVEWPVTWDDLPKTYTDTQKQLLQRFDKQPNSGSPLWPINQKALDRHLWPQYYIGSYPYCYRLPQFPETLPPPPSSRGAGSNEMQAHHGMSAAAMVEQGGTLKMGQSPGTHWYHAHKHGSTTIDVSNGFVGAFIIEGQYDDEINQVYKAYGPEWTRTQPVMVINQFGTSPNLKGSVAQGGGQDKGPDFSVNGQTDPVINMKPGEVQMWRILNASGRAGALFLTPPAGLNWKVLARDGVQLYTDNYAKSGNQSFLVASGNRIDLLVQAACANQAGCTYPVLVENTVDPGDLISTPGKTVFPISLATIKVAGTPVNMPFPDASPASTFPSDLGDIADNEVTGTQTIDFATVPQQFGNGAPPKSPAAVHTINGKLFDGEVGVSVLLNKVEEWTVTNSSMFISHPFHIHINPFQITELFSPNSTLPNSTTPVYEFDNPTAPTGQCYVNPVDPTTWKPCMATVPAAHRIWWDVFPIPSGQSVTLPSTTCTEIDKCPAAISKYTACTTTKGVSSCAVTIPGYFKMRSRFVDYPGWFVIHCHILAHEDRGMMTVVEVSPLVPPYSHH